MTDKVFIKERIKKIDGSFQQRQYLKKQKFGSGGFAQCFRVERTSDKKQFALKIISKEILDKPKIRQKMLSQIKLHIQAKHKNICELYRAFEDEQNVYMLLELCQNKDVFQLIKRRRKLTVPQVQFFMYQLVDALCYLHTQGIIHRDLKLGNLLLDGSMNLKLGDFGLATKPQFKGDLKHSLCGTPNYIAPQIIKNRSGQGSGGHSFQVDIWSLGVIMYFLLIGKAPFETANKQLTYQKIQKAQFSFPQSFKEEEAKDLLRKILVVDPCKRFTFQQILAHPFMNPKGGIPKQLPLICLQNAPKFGIFEKYNQEPVKKAALNASVTTIRSQVQQSLQRDFDDIPDTISKKNPIKDQLASKKASKQLISNKSIVLSKSLKKLSDLSRNSSPQIKNISGLNTTSLVSNKSINRLNISINTTNTSMQDIAIARQRSKSQLQQIRMIIKKKQIGLVYINQYKHESVWSYQLSNGYVGTYQSNYQILYNSNDKIHIQIKNDQIKVLKKTEEISNEALSNRKKFLKNYQNNGVECEPYVNKQRLVYLVKIYKVDSQNLVLFRLSNGTIQAHDYKKDIHLIITQYNLVMIEIQNGKQINKVVELLDNYEKCPAKMLEIYKHVKKILVKINNKKSN